MHIITKVLMFYLKIDMIQDLLALDETNVIVW